MGVMASSKTSLRPVCTRSVGVRRGVKVDKMVRARERIGMFVESRRVRRGGI